MTSALALVETRGQQALTTSLVVAEGCGVQHKNAIALVRKHLAMFEELGQLAFETRVISCRGGGQPTQVAMLNEDQATFLITMFRNTGVVLQFKLKLVKEFRKAIDQIARDFARHPRAEILAAKRASNRPMLDALIEAREEAGKETDKRHFMCESKLCNWAVTGRFEALDESALSNADALLLESVRDRNRAYLLAGLDYETRKQRLAAFATRARTKRLTGL